MRALALTLLWITVATSILSVVGHLGLSMGWW
jgi:hypothetical protein